MWLVYREYCLLGWYCANSILLFWRDWRTDKVRCLDWFCHSIWLLYCDCLSAYTWLLWLAQFSLTQLRLLPTAPFCHLKAGRILFMWQACIVTLVIRFLAIVLPEVERYRHGFIFILILFTEAFRQDPRCNLFRSFVLFDIVNFQEVVTRRVLALFDNHDRIRLILAPFTSLKACIIMT